MTKLRAFSVSLAVSAYIGSVVVANSLTAHFGFVSVGFGYAATAGTYAAAFALTGRDIVQDVLGRRAVIACIATAALLSGLVAPAKIAIASGVAFALSELADFAVYTPLRERGWSRAVVASGVVGALVDTVVFLWLAGFPLRAAFAGQMVGKIEVTLLLAAIGSVPLLRRLAVKAAQ